MTTPSSELYADLALDPPDPAGPALAATTLPGATGDASRAPGRPPSETRPPGPPMQPARGGIPAGTRDVAAPVAQPLRHVGDAFGRSMAVVLGVNNYTHGVPRLKTAVPDAEAIAAMLETQHGFTTLLRRDAEVTAASLRTLFERELADELRERDRLLVYFAGHGVSLPSERGPEGQLLFSDADAADPRSFFAMSELRKLMRALPCRHVLVVLDCCFAGAFRWAGACAGRHVGTRASREALDRFTQHRAWQVLVSASHDQIAFDRATPHPACSTSHPTELEALGARRIETGPHSPFAAALLRGLRGAADLTHDRLITATKLALYVRDEVERSTHVQQTPQLYPLEEHDRGEFVFQVPGTILDLAPAPALSLAVCPYQGLLPYNAAQGDRFFGRTHALAALVNHVKARRLTIVLGASGVGKSSLIAAGLVPALRATGTWTVAETRAGVAPEDLLREVTGDPREGLAIGPTLLDRVTAWMTIHPAGRLCLTIDPAEALWAPAGPEVRSRALGDLARTLDAHRDRLRVVLALRSELEPMIRRSALGLSWDKSVFHVPAPTRHELREIVERPARALELWFEPPTLVNRLIDDVLQAPGALPLLSFALRELYVRCAERGRDRLLTEDDYDAMGGLCGAVALHATRLLETLVDRDPAYEVTARRVLLRMVVPRGDAWERRRVPRGELVYADNAENQRVAELLKTFRDARLLVYDEDEWEPAHDCLCRWPKLRMWRTLETEALTLQLELAEASSRWQRENRTGGSWARDARLRDACDAMRAPDSWLNARERAFVAASVGRRRASLAAGPVLSLILAAVASAVARAQAPELRSAALQTNVHMARFIAGDISHYLGEPLNEVVGMASNPEILQLLRHPDGIALERRRDGTQFESIALFDRSGVLLAHAPVATHRIGLDYSWRDYHIRASELGRRGLRAGYISRVFRSEADGRCKFAISAPVYDPDTGAWIGVVMATIGAARLGRMRLEGEHDASLTVLVAPRDRERTSWERPREHVVILHHQLAHGADVTIESPRLHDVRDAQTHTAPLRWLNPAPITDDAHLDPVFGGRWLAGFAPVGETGFVVIVQSRYDAATESSTRLARTIALCLISPGLLWCYTRTRRRVRPPLSMTRLRGPT